MSSGYTEASRVRQRLLRTGSNRAVLRGKPSLCDGYPLDGMDTLGRADSRL